MGAGNRYAECVEELGVEACEGVSVGVGVGVGVDVDVVVSVDVSVCMGVIRRDMCICMCERMCV